MKFVRRIRLVIILSAGLLLCQRDSVEAQMQQTDDYSHMDVDESGGAAGEPAEVQMARAIAAGPRHVTDSPDRRRRCARQESGSARRQQRLHVPTWQPQSPWPSRIVFERGGATVECGYGCAQSQAGER